MSYPADTGNACAFLARTTAGWSVSKRGAASTIDAWDAASIGRAQPTEQEVVDALADATTVNGQIFSAWLAEHGGDDTLTQRRKAREATTAAGRLETVDRAELAERNRRDNYLANRVIELQGIVQALRDAIVNSAGNAQAIRDAVDLVDMTMSATATRPRADARNDLIAEIDSGGSDT